jgi:hypothetical protein
MNELTHRLATGEHPVIMGGSSPSLQELRRRVAEIGYMSIKFTDTRGGTDLGFQLDTDATKFRDVDFDQPAGTLHVEGNLVLNDDPVRVIADLDLETLNGTGRLVLLESEVAV